MDYPSPLNAHGIRCLNTPPFGPALSTAYNVSSAIIIPLGNELSILETCGHVGLTSGELSSFPAALDDEVQQAFASVDATLRAAGVRRGWQDVYKMTSYHVGSIDDQGPALERCLAKYLGANRPAWTGVTVAGLSGKARIEICVTAVLKSGAGAATADDDAAVPAAE